MSTSTASDEHCRKIYWTNHRPHDHQRINTARRWLMKRSRGQVPATQDEIDEWSVLIAQGWRAGEIQSIRENILCQLAVQARPVPKEAWWYLRSELIKSGDDWEAIRSLMLRFLQTHQISLKRFQKDLSRPLVPEHVYQIASKMYQSNKAHNRAIAARALWYERQIEHVLASQDVTFRTERDILEENPDARCTPDIWFPDPVTIYLDGEAHEINWLDAKSMLGTPQFKMQLNSLKKQSAKYNEEFGPGAFVFHYGFDLELQRYLPNVLLLDYFPKDPLPKHTE